MKDQKEIRKIEAEIAENRLRLIKATTAAIFAALTFGKQLEEKLKK